MFIFAINAIGVASGKLQVTSNTDVNVLLVTCDL